MIDRRSRILFTILIGMLLLMASGISSSYAQGNPPDFTGSWQTERQCRPVTVILTQAGDKVTGTFSPGNGKILAGVVTGNKLDFKWTEDGADGFGEFIVNWDGKGFTGTSSNVRSSGGWVVVWKTSTPPVTPFAGVWQTWMGRNVVSLTMVQSGDHVMGTYQGNGRLEGTISGKVLRFQWRSDSGTGSGRFIMEELNNSFSGSYNRGSNPDDVESTWNGKLPPEPEGRPGRCDPVGMVYSYPKAPRLPTDERGRNGNVSEAELARMQAEYEERMKNAPVAFDGVWQTKSGEKFVFPQLLLQQPTSNQVVGHLFAGRPDLGTIKDGIVVRNTLRFTVWRPNPTAFPGRYVPDIQVGIGELVMDADGKSFKGTVMGAVITGTRIAR